MKKSVFLTRIMVCFLFIVIIFSGTLPGEITKKFRNFLYSNAELISRLAHPTNEYIDAYVDSNDYLVITNKCSLTDDYQKLKIYISPDLETFEVIHDDDFFPAFTAVEFIKDLLIDIIKDIEMESRDSEKDNKVVRAILEKIDDMDGKQMSHIILFLGWLKY